MQSTLPKHSVSNNVNLYQPHQSPGTHSAPEEEHFKGQFSPHDIPPGAYPPNSPHSRYDGRYIYDHEAAAPPRPPLPTGMESGKT